MRVLHVGKYYPPMSGGMERVLQTLCEAERPNIDSRVLVANNRASTTHDDVGGVPVTRVARYAHVGTVAVSPAFPLWLRREAGDLIVVHEPNPLGALSLALQPSRRPSIVWFHSGLISHRWFYPAYQPLFRWTLRVARRIVVASPALIKHSVELEPHRQKSVVIPYGIDVARFAVTAQTERRIAELRRRYSGPIVLFVGRFVPYKGIDVLLRSLPGVNATAVLVGDGPLRPALMRLAETVGLGDRVVFAGELPDNEILALYHACDVFVLPSVSANEAFGMVQLEAMACGKPVVSTDLPSGVPWVNRDGETGLVIAPADPAPLHAALVLLLGDSVMRTKMGEQGRRRVMEEFTTRRMAQRTRALYESVMAEGR